MSRRRVRHGQVEQRADILDRGEFAGACSVVYDPLSHVVRDARQPDKRRRAVADVDEPMIVGAWHIRTTDAAVAAMLIPAALGRSSEAVVKRALEEVEARDAEPDLVG